MDSNNLNTQEVQNPEEAPVYNNAEAVASSYDAVVEAPVYGEGVAEPASQNGKNTAATVLGIISLFVCLGPASFICAIIATVLGTMAWKKSNKTTGKAGMIMGIIALVLWVLIIIAAIILFVVLPALGFAGVLGGSAYMMNETIESMELMPSYYY